MEISKSIWRHLSFCFRNARKVSVEKTWEHNPCGLKRGAEGHSKSICHWKQQVPSWLLWHMYPHQKPFQHWMVFITWSAAFMSGPQPHIGGTEQQPLQNYSASSGSRYPQTTRIKGQRPKKHCKTKRKYGEMRKPAEHRTHVKLHGRRAVTVTEQDSQTPLQLLVEAVRCLFSSSFPLLDGLCFPWAAAWSLMAGRLLLRHTDYAVCRILKAVIFIWGDWGENSSYQ